MLENSRLSYENEILTLVRNRGFVGIDQLANHFDVTPQTVRRRVNALCAQGLLLRLHGGVSRPPLKGNMPYPQRQVARFEEKQRIAASVAAMVEEGSSVSLGIGTTTEQVAWALRHHRDLRVVTNNINVVNALAHCAGISIMLAGGPVRNDDLDIIGQPAVDCFAMFKADYAIFGVGGIDEDGSLLDFNPGEAMARQAMRANCRTSMLVFDHTKLGRRAMVRGGRLSDFDHCFTDRTPQGNYASLFNPADGNAPALHIAMPESSRTSKFEEPL